ncbi:hypothetical protein GTZ99_06930 [Novosphingobium sp. FSY-8]|uniref:DUF2059 domain-containing protein n=1 Tax=Novosphingobium ovatum TaxID=1908523 RepID=A0ABW9XCM0_9SPHN|nr:hypothetical protein [Novosphingobium ovatum]NBC36291.1 hypothetical protein [Novosphingobium ovatum]
MAACLVWAGHGGIAIAQGAPPVVVATAPPAPLRVPPAPTVAPVYVQLAEVVVPDSVARFSSLQVWRMSMEESPEFVEGEKRAPGLKAYVLSRITPLIENLEAQIAAGRRAEMAALFARHLTPEDASAYMAWRQTPYMLRMSGSRQPGLITHANSANGQTGTDAINGQQLSDMQARRHTSAASRLTTAEKMDVLQFMAGPVGRKITVMADEQRALERQMVSRPPLPEYRDAVVREIQLAIAEFVERTDPEAAKVIRQSIPPAPAPATP